MLALVTAAAAPALYGFPSSPSSNTMHFPPTFSPVFDSSSDMMKGILSRSSPFESPSPSNAFLPILDEPPSSQSQFTSSFPSRIPIFTSPQPPAQPDDEDLSRFTSIPPFSRIPLPSARGQPSRRYSPPPTATSRNAWAPPPARTLEEFNASFENGGSDSEGSEAYDVLSDILDCEDDQRSQWDEESVRSQEEFGTPLLHPEDGNDSGSDDGVFDALSSPLDHVESDVPTSPLLLPRSITPLPRLPPPKRSALRKRRSSRRLSTHNSVRWVEWVDVGVAHAAPDYDRTPIDTEPLSKAGALEVVWMRLEMRRHNDELVRERDELEAMVRSRSGHMRAGSAGLIV